MRRQLPEYNVERCGTSKKANLGASPQPPVRDHTLNAAGVVARLHGTKNGSTKGVSLFVPPVKLLIRVSLVQVQSGEPNN